MTADRLQRLRKAVALDLTPLRVSRDYRLLYIGRTVSYAGSMLTTVAFPYQVYQRTHSTLAVGLLGAVELVPLLFMALAGGAYADAHDRRRLLILSEVGPRSLHPGAGALALHDGAAGLGAVRARGHQCRA